MFVCVYVYVVCVIEEGKHLRDPSPTQTQTKELLYVLLHVLGVCDEASVNVLVCIS